METCGPQQKVVSRAKVLLGIFRKIQNLFLRYAKLNPFWVGWTKFPFYEIGQQERGQGCIRNKCEHRALTVQNSSQTFRKSSSQSEILQTVWKPSNLSGNLQDHLEVLKTAKKYFSLSGNLPDSREIFYTIYNFPGSLEHFPDCPEVFHTVQKLSRRSKYFPDFPEIIKTFQKSSRLSKNLLNCPTIVLPV